MIFIKNLRNNKTMILDHLNENDEITVSELKKEIYKKCEMDGRLILCGKILKDDIKINEIKDIYKGWNGKIIYI
tara:strand:- start:295 stop:516 length:222 start_codon:yes stop_codon:yes gene_type:complete